MAEKMVERVQKIVGKPENIRNICTSAHIHHGKTAMTDNLLAASGLMAAAYAGNLEKGMMTWQHLDEQTRLMTVDAANLSMAHDYNGQEYLINMIDTPGHVDFSGNVTRAMRAVDGTVVLVCASDGIMPQTETVIRQALRERVKPVLFVNKVDRLIREMQFTPEQVQERITKIIVDFNRLVEDIAEREYAQKWQVNIADGSVAFGSAKENWAFSVPYMKKKAITFKDILGAYKNLTVEEQKQWFWQNAPLFEVILDMIIKHLPNPLEAQKYRIPRIWHGEPDSEFSKGMLNCDATGKVAFCVTRIASDPKSGREIAAGRLYSGTIKEGMMLYSNYTKTTQRVQSVYMYLGIKTGAFSEVPAGNILALGGLQTFAGDTLTEGVEHPFEELKHIFEPVITKAIEVTRPQDLPKLVEVLKKVAKEDPSIQIKINEETGENLMSGMGELHLEIIENRIKTEKNLEVKTSPPIVVYREAVMKESPIAEGKSPNKHNKVYFKVEPLDDATYDLIKRGEISAGRIKKKDLTMRDKLVAAGWESKTALNIKDVHNGCILLDETRGIVYIGEIMEMVLDMFEDVMNAGPIAREPCIKMRVSLIDCKLHEDAIHRGPAQMYPAVREGIRLAVMQANPVLYEPKQIIQIEAPVDYTGELTKLVNTKRGQLIEMNQERSRIILKAKMPVAEMLGWSSDLRSATEGRGSSSLVDQMFERMPGELQQKAVQQIIQRKGLTQSQLGA